MGLVRYWGSKPDDLVKQVLAEFDGDTVVDPFGGSGTIAAVALGLGKKVVYLDINPYAWLVAHVSIVGASPREYDDTVKSVLEVAEGIEVRRSMLRGDYLRYRDGRCFWKRRSFDRVSEFFTYENRVKLFKLLKAIDIIDCSTDTRLALYLTFCVALFRSSLMNRRGAGTWGIPCYWAPHKSSPKDPFEAFKASAKRFSSYLRNMARYRAVYRPEDLDKGDILLTLGNALTYSYRSSWSLFTDPPFLDEVQYLELSYFYWAWLRESRLPKIMASLLGKKRIQLRFSAELVVNPARGINTDKYLHTLSKFIDRAKHMKEKALIFHAEEEDRIRKIIEITSATWGKTDVRNITIENHRNIGPKGTANYIIIISR